uniref:Putative Zinc Metalloprotease n=1 Tax=Megacormus gertschi TaxID=1843536 RepID=A0A224XGK7_9SCOR
MLSNAQPFTEVESNGNKMRSSNRSRKEKHLLIAVIILAILLFIFIIVVIVLALAFKGLDIKDSEQASKRTLDDVCTSPVCLTTALDILNSINETVDPCQDFYEFACGNWVATHLGPILTNMAEIGNKNLMRLSDYIIQTIDQEIMPEGVKKVAKAYVVCGKYEALTDKDQAWLLQFLQEAGGWPMTDRNWDDNRYHWETNLARSIQKFSLSTPLMVGIDINYFDTTKHIIHIHQHSVETIPDDGKEQILHIARTIGNRENDPSLEAEYEEMERFAQKLRQMSRSDNDLTSDPEERKVLTIKDLNTKIPWVNWIEFLNTIFGPYLRKRLNENEPVLVVGFTFISNVLEEAFKGKVSKRTLANYIGASFIKSLYTVTNKIAGQDEFVRSKHRIGNLLKDHNPKSFSETCLDFYSSKGSYAVDFINYVFGKAKPMDNQMLNYAFSAMKDVIKQATWLDERTRLSALEKLESMTHVSGFPEIAKDAKKVQDYYSALPNITDNPLKNQLLFEEYLFKKHVELLRQKVDRKSWPTAVGGHASQFNAFYSTEVNTVVIPGGILIEPFYSPDRPKFWNYGGFGSVLGHEISHGFDTSGSKRDKNGNIKDWWMPKANQEFEERSKCFIEQYNKFYFGYKNTHVNGTNTVGENVADNGGLHQSFMAYTKWEKDNGKEKLLPGLEKYDTHQLFYLAAAQPYCTVKLPPEYAYLVAKDDEHSPTQFRFKAAAANSEDFAKTFKCKPGTPMNPMKKCTIW